MPSLMRPKGRNSKPHKPKVKMEKVPTIQERAEIVQDVIDRLLYLTPEDVKTYKQLLNALNEQYAIDVQIDKSGLRIYSLNKNLQ